MAIRQFRPPRRMPLMTEPTVRPLPHRRGAGRPVGAGWLAPVFQLRPHRPATPDLPDAA